MSFRGQPQYNYVPVELTHVRQTGGNSEVRVDASGNMHKWRAFGLNTDVVCGPLPSAQPAGNSGQSVHHQLVESEKGGGDHNAGRDISGTEGRQGDARGESPVALHRSLFELSSRIEEAKCRILPRQEAGGGKQNDKSSGADATGRQRRRNVKVAEERCVTKRNAASSNKDFATTACEAHPAQMQGEEQQQTKLKQGGERKNKPSARKSSLLTLGKRATKEPQHRALFTMPSDPAPGPCQAAPVPFREIDEMDFLFKNLQNALNDPHRIQAPALFVAFILHDGETNFSISANSHGKVHFVRGVNPETSHLRAQCFVFRWENDVFVSPAAKALTFLVRVIEELQGVELVTFNAPSLLLLLLSYRQGNLFTSCISDVRIMSWMLQPLDGADAFADYDTLLQSWQVQIGLSAGFKNMGHCTLKEVICHRVYYMAPLYRALYAQLGTQGLLPAFLKQEKRISLLCTAMKLNGFSVNLSEVEGFKTRCIARMEELRIAAQKLVPSMPDFNMQNLEECRVAIYEVLLLGKHLTHNEAEGSNGCSLTITKSGKLSTSEETLRLLAPHHELPRLVIAYRKTAKLLQTYTVGMMETAFPISDDAAEFTDNCISAKGESGDAVAGGDAAGDGRIKWVRLHPNFVQEGTDTGRLSCVEPNLQNLPRTKVIAEDDDSAPHEAEMATFRRCFAVTCGWTLLSVDYEQIELRLLAHLSSDATLIDALTNATDIHRTIAETIFRKSPISSEERTLAKRIVFGTLYGASPRTLATQMGVSVEQALHVASLFKASYPQIDRYHRRVIEQCRLDGFVRTLSGRIRCLPDINDRVMSKRSYAERQAFNTVVQGSAADVMKLAMIVVERDVLQPYVGEVRLLAQVHDEIVLSVPTHKLREVVPLVTRCMTHAVSLLVPLRVTVKLGRSLGELEPWTVDHELGIR